MRLIPSQPAGWKHSPLRPTRRQVLAGGTLALTGASLARSLPGSSHAEPTSARPAHHHHPDRGSRILAPGDPAQVGMCGKRLQLIAQRLQAETQSGKITSASLLVARHGKVVLHRGFGRLNPDPGAPATQPNTVYLLASISKPVTVCGLMLLVEQGRVQLSDPVQQYLPEFQGEHKEKVKVGHLLSHTSGMPDMVSENRQLRLAHAPLSEFVAAALRTPLLYEPGTGFSYQSMGTLLAGEITERMTNLPLRDFLRRKIFDPLGMEHTVLGLDGMKIEETAFFQEGGDPKKPKHWGINSPYWRDTGHPWGGLHSTTGDLAILLQTFLNGGAYGPFRLFSPATTGAMTRDHNRATGTPWGLGWALRDSPVYNYFGDLGSAGTFGHVGATGTVAWADPARDLFCILLTTQSLSNSRSLLNGVSNIAQSAVIGS